jgi:hypothetical protein
MLLICRDNYTIQIWAVKKPVTANVESVTGMGAAVMMLPSILKSLPARVVLQRSNAFGRLLHI